MRRTVISLLACFVAIGPIALPHARAAAPASIDTFFERFTADWVRADPDLATALRYFSGEEQDRLERQVTPNTREQRVGRIRRAQAGLASLRRFDRKTLTATQNLSADLLESQLETIVRGEAYLDFSFPLDQFQGANVGLVETLTLRHPLLVPRDAENYLARLALLGTRMEESLTDARELATRGFIPPQFILSSTLSSMNSFRNLPPEGNPLVTAYEQRLTAIAGLDAAKRSALKQQAATLVANQVYPAWTHAIAFLDSLVPRATSDAGLWRFRGGEAAYAYSLGRFTTTTLSPEQIHAIGLEQVDKIEKEMDRILRQLGRSDGSVRERIAKLKQDLGYADPTSDASRAQIMRDVDGMMKDAKLRSVPLFARQPQTNVIAQAFPRFREAAAAANYNRAPLDGSRPAIFQIPLRPERMTRFGLRTLVYHETIPGHHFQVALEQENPALPRFRQARAIGGIAALSEGWALYAEQVAVESGWYEGDPEGLLGQLEASLFRARRLVVDTGLHAKRWTRQQAIDYGIEASEVERYVVNPGQACAYMIGKLRIMELREKARAGLGDKFSMKDFHNAVLDAGTVPLDILEREVERYVRTSGGG